MTPIWMPGVAALMGLALAGPPVADAQVVYRDRDRARSRDYRDDYRYQSYAQRAGFERGYDDGLKRGRRDGDHRDRYDPARDGRYRDGDHGYRPSFGPRYEYVRAYRTGFEQGYRDGYSAYGYAGGRGYGRYGSRDGRTIYERPPYPY